MHLEDVIETLAAWLDVYVESAPALVEELQERYRARHPVVPLGGGGHADTSNVPELVRASRHEASHAVVATLGGLKVRFARIHEDGVGGAVDYAADPCSIVSMIGRVAADLAAPAFELLEGAHPWRRQQLASSSDILVARLNANICRALAPEWKLPSRFFATISVTQVIENQDAILRVASALLDARELPGARIEALCHGGPRDTMEASA